MTRQQKLLLGLFVIIAMIGLVLADAVNAETVEACILQDSLSNQVGGAIMGGQFFTELPILQTDFSEVEEDVLSQLNLVPVWSYVMTDTEVRPIIFYFYEDQKEPRTYLAVLSDPRFPGMFDPVTGSWERACLLDVSSFSF